MRIGIGTSIVGGGFIGTSAPATEYLDQIEGAGTPTAAYSVRKVVSTYTDAVVRIRRASDNEEADVAFDGDTITLDSAVDNFSTGSSATTFGEFVAASGYTDQDSLGSTDSAYVTDWYDQAGNNDATQDTQGSQPKIYDASTGLVTENGQVALDFDGSDGFLTVQNDSLYRNISYSHGFLVNATDSTGATQTIHFAATGDNQESKSRINYFIDSSNNANVGGRRLDADSFASVTSTASLSVNTQYLRSAQFDFASSDLRQYLNGSLDGESTSFQTDGNTSDTDSINSSGGDNITIGSLGGNANDYNGTIQELIIYNSDKSSLRTQIEANINGFFSIYTP